MVGTGKSPAARDRTTLTCVNGKLYVFGGRTDSQVHLNDLCCYSIAQNAWRTIAKKGAPTPRSHHTTNNINDRLVVFGGNTKAGTGCCNDLHVFDTDSEQWAQPPCDGAIPAARWGHTANVVADTKLVVPLLGHVFRNPSSFTMHWSYVMTVREHI